MYNIILRCRSEKGKERGDDLPDHVHHDDVPDMHPGHQLGDAEGRGHQATLVAAGVAAEDVEPLPHRHQKDPPEEAHHRRDQFVEVLHQRDQPRAVLHLKGVQEAARLLRDQLDAAPVQRAVLAAGLEAEVQLVAGSPGLTAAPLLVIQEVGLAAAPHRQALHLVHRLRPRHLAPRIRQKMLLLLGLYAVSCHDMEVTSCNISIGFWVIKLK